MEIKTVFKKTTGLENISRTERLRISQTVTRFIYTSNVRHYSAPDFHKFNPEKRLGVLCVLHAL